MAGEGRVHAGGMEGEEREASRSDSLHANPATNRQSLSFYVQTSSRHDSHVKDELY